VTDSPEYIEARQTWWDKRNVYEKELETATHFYELQKSLFLARHLDPDCAGIEDQMKYEMLEDAALDAQLNVLEVCCDFAKKKSSLDLARREMDDAKQKFDIICKQESQKTNEVAA
tara:strand:- start:175 stop:522 length:348 start_codon:yes stop_codon:yes gene_type:complete